MPSIRKVVESFVDNPKKKVRTSNGSISVVGGVLYSYQTPIAYAVGDEFFINDTKYSVTTSRHQNLLKGCVPDRLVTVLSDEELLALIKGHPNRV